MSNTMNECCEALTANCLSCQSGQTVGEYCKNKPSTAGCDSSGDLNDLAQTDEELKMQKIQERKQASIYYQEIQRQILRIYFILILLEILVYYMY